MNKHFIENTSLCVENQVFSLTWPLNLLKIIDRILHIFSNQLKSRMSCISIENTCEDIVTLKCTYVRSFCVHEVANSSTFLFMHKKNCHDHEC